MITIICGENNRGKTAKIKSIYAEDMKGDGFITEKIFSNSIFCGYKITRLSTGESVTQSFKTEFFPLDENVLYTCGSLTFKQDGFDFAESIIHDIIDKRISPVFIDEIGPLELKGKGIHDSFKKILRTDGAVYFTVRKHCFERAVRTFSVEKYTLINI